MLKKLFDCFPAPDNYDNYVEPYGGSGVVLLNKPRSSVEVYNDLEQNVATLFKVLTDPGLFSQFHDLCQLAPYDESLSNEYRLNLRMKGHLSQVQRAFQFWYVNRTRVNGIGGFSVNSSIRRHMSKSTSDFLSSVESLPAIHNRLSGVIVQRRDALELIKHWDRPLTLMYLDPPYVQSARGDTRYTVDADDSHHARLISLLLRLKHANIVLSGYDNPLYEPLTVADWRKEQFVLHVTDGNRKPKDKTETVWMNFRASQLTLF